MLREFGSRDPAARSARPEQFVDLTFIKELDASGFIDRLYKAPAVAKAAPRAAPVPAPVESKVKAVAGSDEVAKPVAKQVPPAAESPVRPKAASVAKAGSQEYIIKPGDSLSRLAERFYNSMTKWEKIYEANRDTVKNPNYVYVGQKIVIPPDEHAN
jgi:nucleoid-associated protein YgaU